MAKMFYSLEEAAEKLGKSASDVRDLVSSGQLQEFRDRDRLMFKREQVDLLAGDDSVGGIPLADSKGGSGLTLALEDSSGGGSGEIALDDAGSKEKSGISIFDTESTEEGDANAVTRITNAATAPELSLESVGSGSGLLDLTREGDDTSLGADLLEDVYKGDEEGGADTQGSSGLFEPTSAASDVSAGAAAGAGAMVGMVAAEPYDGGGSGMAGGAALAGVLICGLALVATVVGLTDSGKNVIADLVASNFFMWIGILFGAGVLMGLVGWLIGKKTTA